MKIPFHTELTQNIFNMIDQLVRDEWKIVRLTTYGTLIKRNDLTQKFKYSAILQFDRSIFVQIEIETKI